MRFGGKGGGGPGVAEPFPEAEEPISGADFSAFGARSGGRFVRDGEASTASEPPPAAPGADVPRGCRAASDSRALQPSPSG